MPELRERQIRRYGWRRSLPDIRDDIADTSEIKVLDEVDPRGEMTPIYNQLNLGSCTANGVGRVIDYDRIVAGLDPYYPSRLAIYWFERKLEHSPLTEDTGAEGRDGFRAARHYGIPPESKLEYTDDTSDPRFFTDPRDEVDASDFIKLEHRYKLVPQSEDHMKAVLSNKQMIAFGFTVYESFESPEVEKTGIVPMPKRGEEVLGGHEMVIIGFLRDMPLYALIANSWGAKKVDGTEWGIDGEGCCLMPWSYLIDPRLTSDVRTIRRPVS